MYIYIYIILLLLIIMIQCMIIQVHVIYYFPGLGVHAAALDLARDAVPNNTPISHSCPRFVPRVGFARHPCFDRYQQTNSLSALRMSKGWVQSDTNLRQQTGCNHNTTNVCALSRDII